MGMELDSEALNNLKPHEIAAHCLWELSFCSFDEEETQSALKYINDSIEELENEITAESDKSAEQRMLRTAKSSSNWSDPE